MAHEENASEMFWAEVHEEELETIVGDNDVEVLDDTMVIHFGEDDLPF